MSGCVLFPASLSKNRAWSVWADRESYLSLAEGTYTLIRPRVQPCGWKRYVRVDYRDSRFNESHQTKTSTPPPCPNSMSVIAVSSTAATHTSSVPYIPQAPTPTLAPTFKKTPKPSRRNCGNPRVQAKAGGELILQRPAAVDTPCNS